MVVGAYSRTRHTPSRTRPSHHHAGDGRCRLLCADRRAAQLLPAADAPCVPGGLCSVQAAREVGWWRRREEYSRSCAMGGGTQPTVKPGGRGGRGGGGRGQAGGVVVQTLPAGTLFVVLGMRHRWCWRTQSKRCLCVSLNTTATLLCMPHSPPAKCTG